MMFQSFLCLLFLYFGLSLPSVSSRAAFPPRGWNSYDSFCWTVSEEEFLQNADILKQRLLPYGYEYAVVDYLWYRRKVPGANINSRGFDVIDEWGRVIPDPVRWPSSSGGKGFTQVARKVHDAGLKFGIHVMRGISTQAYDANTPILDIKTGRAFVYSGREWRAKDIGIAARTCGWMQSGFMSVNTNLAAGKAFLRSLYQQYADWGVDFVKNDCVFGDDLDIGEITYVSQILQNHSKPIVYSLSPGTSATPAMAKGISKLVNMYRVTGDDWDSWPDVVSHFDVARDFASSNLVGTNGLNGRSWPDLDMLPFGWLTDPGSNDGPHRLTNLNLNEQRTQMTLWAMAKSPLMYGGDLRKLDETTYDIITNPLLLELNSYSTNNREFASVRGEEVTVEVPATRSRRRPEANATATGVSSSSNRKMSVPTGGRYWIARGRLGMVFVAFFNLNNDRTVMSKTLSDIRRAMPGRVIGASCNCREVWSGNNHFPIQNDTISINLEPHMPALFVLICKSPPNPLIAVK